MEQVWRKQALKALRKLDRSDVDAAQRLLRDLAAGRVVDLSPVAGHAPLERLKDGKIRVIVVRHAERDMIEIVDVDRRDRIYRRDRLEAARKRSR